MKFFTRIIGLLISFVANVTTASGDTGIVNSNNWARRGIAVFSNISFDFGQNTIRGPIERDLLTDCSEKETICFRSTNLELSLPRWCNFTSLPQHTRSLGQTDVLTEHRQLVSDRYELIIDNRYPAIVYEYNQGVGIVGISISLRDFINRTQPVAMLAAIKDGSYSRRRGKDWSYSPLITLDNFGACLPRSVR